MPALPEMAPSLHRGPSVLRSPTAWTLYLFWATLGLAYVLPTPLQDLVVGPAPLATPSSAPMPTVATTTAGVPPKAASAQWGPTRPAAAPPSTGSFEGQPIEDPHRSLQHVATALARTRDQKSQGLVRVVHYGDSQIDLDHVTSQLRAIYQERYGDGGQGFVRAAKPWPWFYLRGVVLDKSEGWESLRLFGGRRYDGRLGVAGTAVQSVGGRSRVRVALAPEFRASAIEVAYLAMPGGGQLELRIDGKRHALLATVAARRASAFHRIELADARHQIVLRVSGRVRLFGVTLERAGPGVTWENLALVGTRFDQLAGFEAQHWSEQLKRRSPDLVLFQFGPNDTVSHGASLAIYRSRVAEVVQRLRRALPHASCLVIGPPDRLTRRGKGRGARSSAIAAVDQILAIQREVALEGRCAFWDSRAAMGGAGVMPRWVSRGMVRKDYLHLNHKGSSELARLLDEALQHSLVRF